MKDLYLIGGGGHCASCVDVIEQEGKFQIKGIFDVADKVGQSVLGYRIIDIDSNILQYQTLNSYFLITLGQIKTAEVRKKIFQLNLKLATIVSPFAYVSSHASLGEGTIVMHQALINAGAKIGRNCIVNTKSLIEHDSIVGDHCHISTAAVINGNCRIGEGSFVGSNSVLKNGRIIPAGSVIPFGEKK